MSVYYNGNKTNVFVYKGTKYKISIDKVKGNPVMVLKPVKSDVKKEQSNS